MTAHPDAPRIKLTESTDAKNSRLADHRAKQTKDSTTMKTLGELEQENPEGFQNPTRTPEQEAASARIRAAKRAYEDANTPTETTPDDQDEDQDEDDTP